jgi:hypothetical protein
MTQLQGLFFAIYTDRVFKLFKNILSTSVTLTPIILTAQLHCRKIKTDQMCSSLNAFTLYSFFLFLRHVYGSFFALGPPAAPVLRHINSSDDIEPLIKSFAVNKFLDRPNIPDNNLKPINYPRLAWNSTVPTAGSWNNTVDNGRNRRYTNESTKDLTDVDLSAAGYWFLADTKFKHLVSDKQSRC